MKARMKTWVALIGLLAVALAAAAPVSAAGQKGLERVAQAAEQAAQKVQKAAEKAVRPGDEGGQGQFETKAGDVINRHGDVRIPKDKSVNGDVVAVGGTAHIAGKVAGNVVAVKGAIHLYDGAEVKGDAVALGGQVTCEPQAKVAGSKVQLSAEWAEVVAGQALPPSGSHETAGETPSAVAAVNALDEIVRFGGPIRVKANEEVKGDVVGFGGPIDVEGHVKGDLVAIGGPITVSGKVDGDAVGVGGPMHLRRGAEIRGDAVTVGGPLSKDDGVVVHGTTSSTGLLGQWELPIWSSRARKPALLVGRLLGALAWLVVTILVVVLVPRQTEAIATRIAEEPWRALTHGVVGLLLLLPILLVLFVLVVTWVAIPVFLLAVVVLCLMGTVGVNAVVGRRVCEVLRLRTTSILGLTVLGFLALHLVEALGFAPALPIRLVASLVGLLVLVFGFGGALMTGFGSDPTGTWLARRMVTASAQVGPGGAAAEINVVPPEEMPSVPPTAVAATGDEPLGPGVHAALAEVAQAGAARQEQPSPAAPPAEG